MIAEHHNRVIAHLSSVLCMSEAPGHNDVGISRADKKAVMFERIHFGTQLLDRHAELAVTLRRQSFVREFCFELL